MADEMDGTNGHKPNVRLVTRLVVGERNFESEGYCYVKTTSIVNGEMVVEHLKLPIRSAGIREILDRVEQTRPRPTATVVVMVSGDTTQGQQIGIPRGKSRPYRMGDLDDPDYREKLLLHERETMFAIINQGLAVDFVDKDDRAVAPVAALQTMKLSVSQFTEIQEAIESLTKSTDEERAGFTGRRSTSETILETPTV